MIELSNGVDHVLGLIHNIYTKVNTAYDIEPARNLPHADEQRVFGDAGY